jgi:hypothetical protein
MSHSMSFHNGKFRADGIQDTAKRKLFLAKLERASMRPSTTVDLHRTGRFDKEDIREFITGKRALTDETLYYWTGSLEGKELFIARICSYTGRGDQVLEDIEKGECSVRIFFFDSNKDDSEDIMMWLIIYTLIIRHIFLLLKDHAVIVPNVAVFGVRYDVLSLMGFEQKGESDDEHVLMWKGLQRNKTELEHRRQLTE